MAGIEKELIMNIPRLTLNGFELTEKEPRMIRFKKKSLSEKKGMTQKPYEKKFKKSKKTTKRDDNRSFRK